MSDPATYLVTCWSCLGEFDALAAVWCSDDPKNPTKLCPFCLRCFCDASTEYKQQFWRHAPPALVEELQTLSRSRDRLGDVLIRLKKITTPQLLDALGEQRRTGKKLGEILVDRRLVLPEDVEAALRTQGVTRLKDTRAVAEAGSPYWERSEPDGILDYLFDLGARKRASDVSLEPQPDQIAVRYRIDGFAFRIDPIPKRFGPALEESLFATFQLDPARRARPQTGRLTTHLLDADYDLIVNTVPGPHGLAATVRLVNRDTFIKDFTSLGLELDDRVQLVEQIRAGGGLLLLTSPAFNGALTTFYAVMNFLIQGQRDVLSVEAPIQWTMEGARQVAAEVGAEGPRMEPTLRAMLAVRPEIVMLSSLSDRATASLALQMASSMLVVAALTVPDAARGLAGLRDIGVPAQLLADALGLASGQRLVRTLCRICRVPAPTPSAQTLAAHGISAAEAETLPFFRGKGCPTCNSVGYRGRRAVFELIPGTMEVRDAIARGGSAREIHETAAASGMQTLRERCLALVREGVTTFDEFARLRL